MPRYESIVIDIYYFTEGRFWCIGQTAYATNDGPDDPESYGDSETADSQEDAIQWAESMRDAIMAEQVAGYVTILLNGSEFSCNRQPAKS